MSELTKLMDVTSKVFRLTINQSMYKYAYIRMRGPTMSGPEIVS